MNQHPHFIYPIILHSVPDAISFILQDAGVPVVHSQELPADEISQFQIHLIDADTKCDVIDSLRASGYQSLTWQSLVHSCLTGISTDPDQTEQATWVENGIRLTERIVKDAFRSTLLQDLKSRLEQSGIPWIQLSPFPSRYDSALNFRVDIDEPAPDDWLRVVRELDALEPAVTWFLCTNATEKNPEIYDWLSGRDVHSHGHWHHVHQRDAILNQGNLEESHKTLARRNFNSRAFAAPAGRLTPDLTKSLQKLNYQYLAGIGGPDGFLPYRGPDGIWRCHCLPVSEGLYLDQGIDDTASIIDGYIQIAERAGKYNRPLFWYGHAERRLGRRPEILRELVRYAQGLPRIWLTTPGAYIDWLNWRNQIEIRVQSNSNDTGQLMIDWNLNSNCNPDSLSPDIWIEQSDRRWKAPMHSYRGTSHIEFSIDSSTPIFSPEPTQLQFGSADPNWNFRHELRLWLDWERETPVEILRSGTLRSKLKAGLRAMTDNSWRRRFSPREWQFSGDVPADSENQSQSQNHECIKISDTRFSDFNQEMDTAS